MEEEKKKQLPTKPDKERTQALKQEKLSALARPKDQCMARKTLMELHKKFPMDNIVTNMMKNELMNNRLFRYPEEYELYNEEEEEKIKVRTAKPPKKKDAEEEKKNRRMKVEQLKNKEKEKDDKKKEKEGKKGEVDKDGIDMDISKHVKKSAIAFVKSRKGDTDSKMPTLKKYIADTYAYILQNMKDATEKYFPNIQYGVVNEEAKKKLYPKKFKMYFLDVLRSMHVIGNAKKCVSNVKKIVPFWIPSSKPVRSDDKHLYLGETSKKSSNAKGKIKEGALPKEFAEEEAFSLQAWAKNDMDTKQKKQKILMTLSDVENCTFRPKITAAGEKVIHEDADPEYDPNVIFYPIICSIRCG